MKTKRIFSLLLCLVIFALSLSSALITSAAVERANIFLSVKKYSAQQQNYILSSDFSLEIAAEKTVYVPVSVLTDSTVGGFGFTLDYDKNILEFNKEASFLAIADKKGSLSAHDTDNGVTILWETYSDNTYINGEFYYAAFDIKDSLKENKTTNIALSVKQIYDGTSKQVNIIPSVTVSSAQINIKASFLTEEELEPYKKLKNIAYPESSADIKAANEAFKALSSVKKEQLKTDYPTLYNYFATAQSRYNRLAEAAAEQAVIDELNAYLQKYAQVFKLTPETVKISDKTIVKDAISAKDALSKRASELLGKNKKDLLTALLAAIEEKEEIAEEVKQFNDSYSYLTKLTETDIATDAKSFLTILDEALMVYETLTDGAKKELKGLAESLKALSNMASKYVEQDKAAAAIIEKVNAFQAKWIDVLLINSFNVTLGDEKAIEIMLKDFEAQDDEVKQALSSRMQSFYNLLEIIEGMKKSEDELPQEPEDTTSSDSSSSDDISSEQSSSSEDTEDENNSSSEQQSGTSSDNTSTDSTDSSESVNSGDTSSQQTTIIQLPGQTVVSTVTETVVEEKVNTVEKVSFMAKSSKWLIIGLIILLIISIISFLLPFILGVIPKKEKKNEDYEENEDIKEETE